MPLLHITLYFLVGYIMLVGWFFSYAYARELKRRGIQFSFVITWPLYIWLAYGVLLDIIFNATYATIVFRELPKEFLFTQRIKRWIETSEANPSVSNKRIALAKRWRTRINKIEPNHI